MDWHRRRGLRLGEFFDTYIFVGLAWTLILSIVGVSFYTAIFTVEKTKYSERRKLQIAYLFYTDTYFDESGRIINVIDKAVRFERLVAQIKELQNSALSAGSDFMEQFVDYGERIENERKSGKVSLVYVPTWGNFFTNLFTWGLAGFGLLLSTAAFLSFGFYSIGYTSQSSYSLLDLPWQKPWTWIFVALTIPINIPFFAVSAIRILFESRGNAGQEADQIESVKQNARVRWIKPRNTNVKAVSSQEYINSKKAWVEIYASRCRENWLGQLELCRKKIAAQRQSLTDYGKIIIRTQGDLAKAQQELRDAEAAEPNFYSDAINPAQIKDEFDRLLNLPAIARVEVTDKAIKIWTHPAIIYIYSQPHDFGSYRITVAVNGDLGDVEVRAVFSTKFKGDGHLYGGDRNGNFCFGTRRETINSLLLRGEYLPAFILMLEGLHHVNLDSEEQAARLYPGVRNA